MPPTERGWGVHRLHSFTVNARFLTRPATGVDRVAIEIISAIAQRPDVARLTLLHPKADKLHVGWLGHLDAGSRAKMHLHPLGSRSGHLWEQLDLAPAQPGSLLLSLCGTGPVLRRNQAVMIHDAQVWDAAASFSPAFRLAYRILLPTIARTARHVLTVSQFAKGRLEDLRIVPQGKTRVVLNGADHMRRFAPDPATLQRYGLVAGGFFLAIGSLAPHKNLRRLTEAAMARAPGGPDLIVAGGANSKVFAVVQMRHNRNAGGVGQTAKHRRQHRQRCIGATSRPGLQDHGPAFGLGRIDIGPRIFPAKHDQTRNGGVLVQGGQQDLTEGGNRHLNFAIMSLMPGIVSI